MRDLRFGKFWLEKIARVFVFVMSVVEGDAVDFKGDWSGGQVGSNVCRYSVFVQFAGFEAISCLFAD
jgi:hypothetical protein